ncbi:efflux RND transporter permease subunit [Candidatus Magnetaquicoccus inordinatus]|uniref:efflux RND transporter permease subunit n=1 Tax=Candidatus Magnetaquicoccus inordinatus TaxID=2496818 RepID=UPI00102C1143|nr:efflux RND transporter permease subunit [Candidatus Magnetaquicoccus inordinatus]
MNVSSWSIRNPVPAILLFALLTLLGLGSFRGLGIQNFPDIEVPVITVLATMEGAAPTQMETEIVRKMEDAIATLGGVEHVRSNISDGSAVIAIEFVIDKDSEVALNEVRNAIDTVRTDLPQEMNNPVISKVTTSGKGLVTFAVHAAAMDMSDLSWFVDNDLSKAILAVPGVGKFARIGGVDREVQIDLHPLRMAALGISAAEISNQLKRVQQDFSGGRGDLGNGVQAVRTLGALPSVEPLKQLEIALNDSRRIRLNEIATIKDSIAEPTTIALLDGKPTVAFEITRIKGSSEVTVANAVRKAVAAFQAAHPQVTIEEAYNIVARVQDNYEGSMELLYEGAFLAILVVWWFLREWRATFVSATALPLSIIPTFLVMRLSGFSLDTLTLLALALVVGVLVDDAIVEIENIVRHLGMGKSPYQAAMEAADEIGLAVIATTLTLVAVFLPTAFMGGIPGKFFRSFGVTAAAAVLVSLLVARLLTPMMAAYLLRPLPLHPPESPWIHRYLGWVHWCMTHRRITIILAIAFFVGSLMLVPLLPKGFVPVADRAQTVINLELAPGSSLADTEQVTLQANRLLQTMPDVLRVFSAIGVAASADQGPLGGGYSSDVRKATLTINLTHRSQRARSQLAIEAEIRTLLRNLPGVRVANASSEPGAKMRVSLASDDPDALDDAIRNLENDLRTLKGLGNITSAASLQRPEIHILPDFARAADLGISSDTLSRTVRIATAGDYKVMLSKLNLPQRQLAIRVRLDKPWRQDLAAIRQLPIAAKRGTVPLSAVAEIKMASGPAQITRMDRLRNSAIDVELGSRVIGQVMAEAEALPALRNLPPTVKHPMEGDAQRMTELFSSFGIAMAIGILCIYMILVLLFHDFMQPITILAALPFSLGGAFISLLATGNSFSMPAVIGILMLMGIVTKNSILLVDYAVMIRREEGLSRLEAMVHACQKRARPIVMTTIAMGAGMLPVALGLGAEPSFRAPMAVVVIGGLLTSTVLSLLFIPVVYTYIDDLLLGLRRLFSWLQQRNRRTE